ncbi:carboxylesterase/lipase family protein [Aquabacterium sp.]|uniref:carboxylesterase/lipase family protein n=1 Tax=Aquabacterium sp. TaxID=1872578 RepID=UPI003783C56A
MTPRDVELPEGRLRGQVQAGVARWLGVSYAQAPLHALRLRAPRPPQPWRGLRDALLPGPACLQVLAGPQTWLNPPLAATAEDCLTLNIWAPAEPSAAPAPVLLWFHGGATRSGHGASPASDGSRLARQHGLVVVTVNYRLGALGGLAHPLLEDDLSGQCANWGLQDKLAALAWVHRSIAAFGGDPSRITIGGQSSGAANVALIVQHGLDGGRAARAIVQSPPLFRTPMFATLDEAAEYTELLAHALDVTVPGLRTVEGARLQQAEHALAHSPELLARMARPRTAPVLDGRLLRAWSHDAPVATMPVLAGWTATESDFWFKLHDDAGHRLSPLAAPTADAFAARAAKLIALHHAFPDRPPAADWATHYAPPGRDPAQAWQALYTDLVFRAPTAHWLARHARAGTPAWGYAFAQPIASADGGTPHAADVPFVFGTVAHPHLAPKIGELDAAERTSDATRAAWSAFVRDGDPGAAAGTPWPRFDDVSPRVMQFGGEAVAQVQPLDRAEALACWPGYALAGG